MNMTWLEKLMAQKGITFHALKYEFHFSKETFRDWAAGVPARPHTVRKLATALGVEYQWLVRNLGVKIVDEKKRALATFNGQKKAKRAAK